MSTETIERETQTQALAQREPERSRDISAEVPAADTTDPMGMVYQLIAHGASVDAVERMIDMSERIAREKAKRAFDEAIAGAKAEIPPILKNRVVDFTSSKGRTNYRHEDMGEIAKTVDPILAKFGLSYRFRTQTESKMVKVTCVVSHRDGHSEENSLTAGHDESGNKNSIQAVGSAITYLQRYTLKAALGLSASNDDDAGKAGQRPDDLLKPDQIEIIKDLIDKTGTEIEKFCEAFKVDAIGHLTVRDFDSACKSLQIKLARKMSETPNG